MGDDLATLDATAQADLVRRGEVTPIELVEAAIARIEALDDELNAVVLRRFDQARDETSQAFDPAAPFAGVPFLTKDLRCPTAGEPVTDGMRLLKDAKWCSPFTSALAHRFRRAGLVNLGRTNSPELGLVPTTEPAAWGATHNPWDPTRSPGGSSGGSAAAVAAGLVPVAHASDGGGSIRIPASACGLVGLKPSRGRVSLAPATAELTTFLSVQFVVSRTVRDSAALLDLCAGPEVGDPLVAPPVGQPYLTSMSTAPARLRIGLMTDAPGEATPVDPECVAAVEKAAKLLESLGHTVERAHPEAFDDPERAAMFGTVWGVNAASALDTWGTAVGRAVTPDDVEPGTWAMAEIGRGVTALEYVAALQRIQEWSRRMASWWQPVDGSTGFDLLLTPTLAEPPAPLGTFAATTDDPWSGMLRAGPYTPFTPAFNLSGQPAISLPLHWSDDGLPIGVHLVAAYAREDVLLSLAAQLEAVAPWSERRPPLHG